MALTRRGLLGAAGTAVVGIWLAPTSPALARDQVDDLVAAYLAEVDRRYLGVASRTSTPALLGTTAASVIDHIIGTMDGVGSPILSAHSTSRLVSSITDPDSGETTIVSDLTTRFTWGGPLRNAPEGSWTNRHTLIFDRSGAVIADTIIEPGRPEPLGDVELSPLGPPSSSDRTLAEGPRAVARMQPELDTIAALYYAMTWTSPPNDGDEESDFNPDFPYVNNNCANFVSQVLRAGGWNYQGGVNPLDTKNWSPDLTGPAGPSRTWVNAAAQISFVGENGYSYLDNIFNAGFGDLLYPDWDPDFTPDGEVDHVMYVAYGAGAFEPGGDPLICQKSSNRNAIPLSQSIAIAESQGRTDIDWYGRTLS